MKLAAAGILVLMAVTAREWAAPDGPQQDQQQLTVQTLTRRAQDTVSNFQNGARSSLVRRADVIRFYCRLDDTQVRRLEVAAAGVSSRMFAPLRERAAAIAQAETISPAVTREARALFDDAQSLWDTAEEHPLWKATLRTTLTADQAEDLKRNIDALDGFRRVLWAYQVVDEVQRQSMLRDTQRAQLLEKITQWVEMHGVPAKRLNARTQRRWDTLPADIRQEIRDCLEPGQIKGFLAS